MAKPIIQQVFEQTEKRLNDKIKKVNERINYDPFGKWIETNQKIRKLIQQPNMDMEEFERLAKDAKRYQRDAKKYDSAHIQKLFDELNNFEEQKRDLLRHKLRFGGYN